MGQAELDIYKERFTANERQLQEAKEKLQETRAEVADKKRWVSLALYKVLYLVF